MKTSRLKIEEYDALLRFDFCAFIQKSFHVLNPQTTYYPNWHIEVMAAEFEAWRKGEIGNLITTIFARQLKTHTASIALPAWILGHQPSAQIICVSYAQDLADKNARDCRTLMQSPFYKRLFPTRLSPQKQSVEEFVTTKHGYRLSTSVGGVLTGRGADYIIIDDPIKANEAHSELLRKGVNEWYSNSLITRLNDKRFGRIMIVMQRLHEDDLVGYVQGLEKWKVLSFPAIAQSDERFVISTPYGKRTFVRAAGEVLHPQREPLEVFRTCRSSMTEHDFNAQLLQAPTSLEGGLAKRSWFKFYKDGDQPARFDQVVQSWDTANKRSQLSDFSVCTTWGVSKKLIYLLGLYRRRVAYPDLKRAVFDQAEKHSATIVLIEDKASGTQLIQELERDGLRIVKPVVPVGEKVMRFNAQTATIYNGFVYLPEQAPWLEEYLHEVTAFPGSKYDDQADSTAQALAWINTLPAEPGWVMWARQEAALGMYRTGKGIAEIAAEKDVTAEEVERWIAEYEAEEAERRRRSALEFAATCRKCGRGIPFGLTYTEVGGGDAYHTECWAKLTNGG